MNAFDFQCGLSGCSQHTVKHTGPDGPSFLPWYHSDHTDPVRGPKSACAKRANVDCADRDTGRIIHPFKKLASARFSYNCRLKPGANLQYSLKDVQSGGFFQHWQEKERLNAGKSQKRAETTFERLTFFQLLGSDVHVQQNTAAAISAA